MKRFAWIGLIVLAATPTAQAQLIYDNTITGTGAFLNGGTANQAGNLITRLVMDDLTFQAGSAGLTVNSISFAVQNSNAVAVSARPRMRFWNADGVGGGPGTYFAGIGFTFSAISFAPGGSAFFLTRVRRSSFRPPSASGSALRLTTTPGQRARL